MIQIEIGRSKELFRLCVALYSVSLLVCLATLIASPVSFSWCLLIIPLAAFIINTYTHKRFDSLCLKGHRQLSYFPGVDHWQVTDSSGKQIKAQIAGHSVVTNAFILLHFNKTVRLSLMIWRDAVTEQQFRQLRYFLYQSYGESDDKL